MKKCLVILNPSSGQEKALDYELFIVEQLKNYDVLVKKTKGEGDARDFARQACNERYDVVVLAGGDGTLNEGITELQNSPIVQ